MGRQAVAWRPIVQFGLTVLIATVPACKSLGPPGPPLPSQQRDLLTREEILSSTARQGDLLQAIQSLRPHFLALPRGVYSPSSPAARPLTVYIDRIRQLDLGSLRSLSAARVSEVRYLDPTSALNEFGPTAGGGALLIKTFDPDKEPNALSAGPVQLRP